MAQDGCLCRRRRCQRDKIWDSAAVQSIAQKAPPNDNIGLSSPRQSPRLIGWPKLASRVRIPPSQCAPPFGQQEEGKLGRLGVFELVSFRERDRGRPCERPAPSVSHLMLKHGLRFVGQDLATNRALIEVVLWHARANAARGTALPQERPSLLPLLALQRRRHGFPHLRSLEHRLTSRFTEHGFRLLSRVLSLRPILLDTLV